MRRVIGLYLALGASCSSDGKVAVDAAVVHDARPIDARPSDARPIDASTVLPDAQTAVVTVTCPTTPDGAVTITGAFPNFTYTPQTTTIAVGGIVKFTTSSIHDVNGSAAVPGCTTCVSDPGMHVPFNQVACKQFTVAANYGMICSVHGFTGHIDVQ